MLHALAPCTPAPCRATTYIGWQWDPKVNDMFNPPQTLRALHPCYITMHSYELHSKGSDSACMGSVGLRKSPSAAC
jgi:hypothetical protein